jgi:hypothetical protein
MFFLAAVLFLLAAVSGALVRRAEDGTNPAPPEAAPGAAAEPATVVRATLPGDGTVHAQVGDPVSLEVKSQTPQEATMPDVGVSELASADLPALLEFVADRPGRFPVLLGVDGRRIGTVVVAAG